MEAFADSFLPLTRDLEFEDDSRMVFDQARPIPRRKFMFASPLPNQQYGQMTVSRSNSGSKSVGVDSPSYIIDGVKIQINTIHYFSALKFDVIFSEDSYIQETNFIDEFINGKLPEVFQTLPNQDLSREFQQVSGIKVTKNSDIETNLEKCVYCPIRPLVKENLDENQQALTANTMDFLVAKGAFSFSSDRAPSLAFDAIFKGGGNEGTQAMGLRAEPDLVIGYTAAFPSSDNVVFLTGVGEVKLPTMDLNPSSHSGRSNSEFARTVKKLTTIAVHCGARRYILTNYRQVVIVELDESFEQLAVTSDATFIRSRHHYFESTHNFVRLFIFSFFAMTKEEIPRLELFKTNIAATLNIAIQSLLEEQRARNFNMRRPDTGSSTQSSASRSREQAYSRSSLGGSAGTNSSTNPSRNDPSTIWSSRPSTNERYSTRKLVIDPPLFVALQAVEVGKCIVKFLQLGQLFQAQVMTVNSSFFLSHINSDNKFCFSDNSLPAVSVLKIYDPFLEMRKHDGYEIRDSTYQDSLDSIVNELNCYRRLEEVQGDLVAEVFAYGNLQDVHESMFYAYFNFQGPFLLLESFDDVKDNTIKASDIDLDFIVNNIVPQFKRLHHYNVIQNDFRFSNIIITKSKEVKIIDFSNSKISYDQQEFDEEIDNIYRYFGETPLH